MEIDSVGGMGRDRVMWIRVVNHILRKKSEEKQECNNTIRL